MSITRKHFLLKGFGSGKSCSKIAQKARSCLNVARTEKSCSKGKALLKSCRVQSDPDADGDMPKRASGL